jgi:hypothetical protein
MKNRLKWYFDQEANANEPAGAHQGGDLAKIVAILNKTLAPHVRAKMVGGEAVIRAKNKTVWINAHCLVTGEASTP